MFTVFSMVLNVFRDYSQKTFELIEKKCHKEDETIGTSENWTDIRPAKYSSILLLLIMHF